MTDPTTLTHEQLIQYAKQLQQTVRYWQTCYAGAKNMTWEEYKKEFQVGPVHDLFKQEYQADE